MRASLLSATLVVSSVGVSALPQSLPKIPKLPSIPGVPDINGLVEDIKDTINDILAPALPIQRFIETPKFIIPLTLEQARAGAKNGTEEPEEPKVQQKEGTFSTFAADEVSTAATCSNPRIRTEWDSYSDSDRQAYLGAIRCLMGRAPSGQFSQSKSRYEDLVALHQTLTPNVHGNAKFLLWHRYYLWTFEDILRSECGFDRNLPWWDETRYSGRFADSSIFSDQWYGGINAGGNCITNGQFANLGINVGPGQGNTYHCLARNNDDSKTINTNSDFVNACNDQGDYAGMASCAEGAAHAWGHNGIGAVMQDVFASPSDPVFWLHHAFIDRIFRIWQNRDGARVNNINGVDGGGNPLTLDTTVNVYDMRPTVQIRDILDTMSDKLCYKYNY